MSQKSFPRWFHLRSVLLLILFASILFIPLDAGHAASFIYVNTFADSKQASDGECSLREAIIAANKDKSSGGKPGECDAGSGADTIVLPAGTYTLTRSDNGKEDAATTGDLDILADVTIAGAGADVTAVTGTAITDRVFHTLAGTVTLAGITIQDGTASENGGGILNLTDLTLTHVAVIGNHAAAGGGIAHEGGTLTISGSTLAANSANGSGGGLAVTGGDATLTNATLSGNSSGLYNTAVTTLSFVTIAENTAVANSGTLTTDHTIFSGSCHGTLTSAGYNLIEDGSGCTISGDTTGNILGIAPQLAPLANYGGSTATATHALLITSPAVEAGALSGCPATDQRGIARPIGATCDIGAYEFETPPQVGGTLLVNTADDSDDGICTVEHCSLREAINRVNSGLSHTIHFDIDDTAVPTIFVLSPLPTITAPVTIDGTTQSAAAVTLDGTNAGSDPNGLTITAGDSTVRGLNIINFGGSGILLTTNDNNVIADNEISHNGGNGIQIENSTGNQISHNDIHDNGGLSIDLNGDGRTNNDTGDDDETANFAQNFPVLLTAVPNVTLTVQGYLNSQPDTAYTLEFFGSERCALYGGGSQTYLGSTQVTSDEIGNIYFTAVGLTAVAPNTFITATATDPSGNTSELSDCIIAGPANLSWPNALTVGVPGDLSQTVVAQYLDRVGQSRWYRFPIQPNSKVIVTLTNLPDNYDLTIYKDIEQVYQSLLLPNANDLALLGAEFAPEAFTPEAFTPEAFSPEAFTPEAFTPEAFTPEAFTASVFSPEAFTPEAFTPEAFSPEAFTPDAYSPEAFTPEAFTPEAFTPEAFTPEAFTGAQMRSLLGVSAFRGTASEGVIVNTWNNTGYFYVRVRGANGAFDQEQPFQLSFAMQTAVCNGVTSLNTASTLTPTAGSYRTIILTNMDRMEGSAAEKATLLARLNNLASRPEVAGVIVDVGSDSRVSTAHSQADAFPGCPYAKNLVAEAVDDIVDGYWALNPLDYVVIVGNDDVTPFFRYPDNALLANESNYIPPVWDASASQASLRLGYVLGQDEYGTQTEVLFKNSSIPIAELGVGRLVETAVEATAVIDAYLSTPDGIVTPANAPLVTGYDFLEDVALAVQNELELGTGLSAETLITPQTVAPTDPSSWTAADLRHALLNSQHDIVFLAGHFSASGALAADYSSRITAAELAASSIDMRNMLVFSEGCHSGYNIVNADGVPFVTEQPDWAQAFASKGAAFIGGTGYQYGETELIEYGERLYLTFSQQLRTGTGPVAIGDALAATKRTYLANTPLMRGIHQKTIIQSTLFGLPMLQIDLPGQRLAPNSDSSIVSGTTAVAHNPGQTLGLRYADVSVTPQLTLHNQLLTDITNGSLVAASYLSGSDGVVANPAEPILPLEMRNVSHNSGTLRGVVFRGGHYTDLLSILPLTGAATTEIRGVHAPFLADFFYPIQLWQVNYFDALSDGPTRLALTPAQFRSTAPGAATGTLRRYDSVNMRLYYSDNTAVSADSTVPALSSRPTIVQTTAVANDDQIEFEVIVVGNPAVGIQEVVIAYTAVSGTYAGQWQPLDLVQDRHNSTIWRGALPLAGTDASEIRYLVQAVNGVGLVSLAANLGDSYQVGTVTSTPPAPAELALSIQSPTATGAYGTEASFTAVLTANGAPAPGQIVTFRLGLQSKKAVTDDSGAATATLTLLGLPGQYTVQAAFGGSTAFAPVATTGTFIITKQATSLTLAQTASSYPDDAMLTATLMDANGRRLTEKTVFFVITGAGGALSRAVITDFAGRATLSNLPTLPPGAYNVTVYFNGTIVLDTGATLTLTNDRYLPSNSSGSLTLLDPSPVAHDDVYAVDQDTMLTVTAVSGVLANDSDPNGDLLTAVLVAAPQHGTLSLNADGAFTYTPDAGYFGSDAFTYQASDGMHSSNTATVQIAVNQVNSAPDCSGAYSSVDTIWPVDKRFVAINILGVSDADGQDVAITITSIFQDERVGKGGNAPDGMGVGTETAYVRAERDGNGNGRVYHVAFTAADGVGGACSGQLRLPTVPHDQSYDLDAIDGGALYDSTIPD